MDRSILKTEEKYFEANKTEYFSKYLDKYVLIKGEELVGVFDTAQSAYEAGLAKFGNQPMFIKNVKEKEPEPHLMYFNIA